MPAHSPPPGHECFTNDDEFVPAQLNHGEGKLSRQNAKLAAVEERGSATHETHEKYQHHATTGFEELLALSRYQERRRHRHLCLSLGRSRLALTHRHDAHTLHTHTRTVTEKERESARV